MTLTDLERLALAATPGKWAVSPATSSYFGVRTVCGRMLFTSIIRSSQEEAQANAAYIAALSPERVLAMIAVIDQMRDALLGVMGLVELIASRDDLPVGLDDLMRLSHRMTEAKAVLAALEGEQK